MEARKLSAAEWEFFRTKYGVETTDSVTEEFLYWMNRGQDPREQGLEWSGSPTVGIALSKLFVDNDREDALRYLGEVTG